MRCPRAGCRQAFFDFEGCFALRCELRECLGGDKATRSLLGSRPARKDAGQMSRLKDKARTAANISGRLVVMASAYTG